MPSGKGKWQSAEHPFSRHGCSDEYLFLFHRMFNVVPGDLIQKPANRSMEKKARQCEIQGQEEDWTALGKEYFLFHVSDGEALKGRRTSSLIREKTAQHLIRMHKGLENSQNCCCSDSTISNERKRDRIWPPNAEFLPTGSDSKPTEANVSFFIDFTGVWIRPQASSSLFCAV